MAQETIGLPLLLWALEQSHEQLARTARRWWLFTQLAILVSCLMGVASIVWALSDLREAWHTGKWAYFWQTVNGVWAPLATGMRAATFDSQISRYADAARTIREMAIRGDEQDAPVAQENSQLIQDSSALFGGVTFGPLKRPRDNRSVIPIVLLCIAVCMTVLLGITLLTVVISGTSTGTAQAEEFLGGIVLLLLLLSAWSLLAVLRMRRGIVVTADETGISWKQVGWRTRRRSIAWHDARAFFVVTQRRSTNWAKDTTWLLVSSSGALVWMAPREETAQTDTPHARFAALVAARTRLPLRDLSAFVDQMTNTKLNTEQRDAIVADAIAAIKAARTDPEKAKAWIAAQKSEQATEAWLSARKKERTVKKSGLGWGCTVQLVLVGVIALLYAGGWGLEQYQPHYYTSMLAQIHASKPLYHDALTYNDDKWDMELMTSYDPGHIFKDDGYHLTTLKGYITHSWTNFQHGDAAVEVTARQIGTSNSDGVGLVLRANTNGSDMVVFYVDTHGLWWLWHYRFVDGTSKHDWTNLDEGYSSAIYTRDGAQNKLTVLMRGNQYVCYVNGRMIEVYRDEQHETPSAGHMGVYLNDGATEGVFTNFTVYSAPPPSIWSAL